MPSLKQRDDGPFPVPDCWDAASAIKWVPPVPISELARNILAEGSIEATSIATDVDRRLAPGWIPVAVALVACHLPSLLASVLRLLANAEYALYF